MSILDTINPSLTRYRRDEPAPVLPLRDEPDLLSLLEASGRLVADAAPTDAALHWCYRCTKQVHPSSKHCTVCRKCVDVFDRACGARRGAGRSQAPLTSSYAAPRRAPSVPSVRKTTACG